MTNYDPYEQDRRHDEDFGQREAYPQGRWDVMTPTGPRNMNEPKEAYNWEWEPDALDRKNRLINAQRAIATYQAMNPRYPRTVTSHEWIGVVGLALLIIAFIIAALMIPAAHGQEVRLPAFEKQFTWAQATWSQSQNQWCIDAQPREAGPGEMVGACAETLQDAKRAVMNDGEALPIMEQPSGQTDSRPDSPEPHVAVKSAHIDPQVPLTEPVRPYWDRTNAILASSMVAVGSFDLAQTCHSIANGGREVWMPMKTCPQLVGVGIAMGLGMTYLSYQLHRHGHYKLERLPFIGMIAGNSAGIAFSKRNGAW